ncbi:MAG: hypothetical protein Q7S53_03150 [bacterium]|nr:hypothetical protein [bacterium]
MEVQKIEIKGSVLGYYISSLAHIAFVVLIAWLYRAYTPTLKNISEIVYGIVGVIGLSVMIATLIHYLLYLQKKTNNPKIQLTRDKKK